MGVSSVTTSRRELLCAAGLAAGSALLAACSGGGGSSPRGSATSGNSEGSSRGSDKVGSANHPLPPPKSFADAPSLRGKGLPPVAERLPDVPYVVPHRWTERGRYGGSLRMVVFGSTGMVNANSCREFFYGFSPTRWLNDGLDIGPGIADRWSSNAEGSEWTIHFRSGLKWSDGHPFSVDDVLFWWEDIVLPGHDGQVPPVDCLSAEGHVCRMTRVDASTLKLTYDSPQPLVPDYLASWVKGGIGTNGPSWVMPKHYLKQFHPKYNKGVPPDWDAVGGLWEQKADWFRNPDCPTLIGYRCKAFDNNTGVTLERNPYYYAVTEHGDQLPYIDEVKISILQNAEVLKLQVQQGKVDYCDGHFNQIDLADVSTLSRTKDQGKYEVLLWDSGSGTGSMFFLNYDYIAKDPKYGKLFRDKRFRQAISHAYDRPTARKTLYFETGETTTGTMGTKAIEFQVNRNAKKTYQAWRDSYRTHDVRKAKALLAEIGLKDVNNDGYVEFPDGSPLTVEIPYSADISTTEAAKDDQLVSDAKKAGLRMVRRPVPPQAFTGAWANGTLMAHTNAEAAGNPNLLVYPGYLIPFNSGNNWAPLETTWNSLTDTPKQQQELDLPPLKRHPPRLRPDPQGPIQKMLRLYNETRVESDAMRRHQMVWEIVKVHINEGPFFMGTVANYPQVITVSRDLRNVPRRENLAQHGWVNPWVCPCPAVYDPEVYYWSDPERHQ